MYISTLRLVQRLARTGDTEQAWKLFESSGLALVGDNADALCLKGRLTKDRALKADGGERATLLRNARSAYLSASTLRPATYPLINAATLSLLAGDKAEARKIADRVLVMLDSGEHEPETEYWLKATRAEALLLTGRDDDAHRAHRAMAEAVRAAPAAWEDHASTLRHFQLILASLGADAAWLDELRPPPSLHFSGAIHLAADQAEDIRAIEGAIEDLAPGFGFGALAAGADILTAEALVRYGAELHVVLPASIDAFRQESVGQFGSHWTDRFDRLLETAISVEVLPDLDEVSEAGVMIATQTAMGLAIRQSRMLEARACALRIGTEEIGQDAARLLDDAWQAQGLALTRLDARRTPARGRALPPYASETVVAIPTGTAVNLLVAAGGTAVDTGGGFATASFADPVSAARTALEIAAIHNIPVGMDCGAFDPSIANPDRFDVAALIAGAAPPGRVLLSRAMVLALALRGPEFDCENFGSIATSHGEIALHVLAPERRTDAG